jgi:gas vesicle protein
MSENNDLGAFLAGFVIGGLVGAATALILAPQSGEETRTQLLNQSLALREAGETSMRQYREMAETYAHEFIDRAEEVGDQVQEQARIVLDSGKERVAQVKGQVDSYIPHSEEKTNGASAGPDEADPTADSDTASPA